MGSASSAISPTLRGAFRPFFLGAALLAVVALPLWAAVFSGANVPAPVGDALAWHRHEMIFGFAGAAVIGFMLTAIANWTGRKLLAGWSVAALAALWLAVRVAFLFGEPGMAMVAEGTLFLVVAGFAAREINASGNRNMPIALAVALVGAASVADLAVIARLIADNDTGWRAGLALIAVLMSLIGGRIIPAFTRNWLVKVGKAPPHPVMPTKPDLVIVAATALLLGLWAFGVAPPLLGWGLMALGAAHLWRLSRWQGWRTLADPLVAVLHLAYLWLPVALLLLGSGVIDPALPRSAGVHALGAGGAGLLILAVMSRASLGHTGRPLAAGPMLTAAYALVLVGAVVRVIAAAGYWAGIAPIHMSATLWAGGFALFLVLYWPILTRAHITDPAR